MQPLSTLVQRFDVQLTTLMSRHGIKLLRISVGVVFLWFGFLKFFPELSPAEGLAARTIETLTFGMMTESISLPILAAWETLIGLGLISGRFLRLTLLLLFVQMIGTVLPVFFFPEETFTRFPYAPTLEGQYIIKNLVLVSAGIVIGATVRGGNMIADPDATRTAREIEQENLLKQARHLTTTEPLA